RPSRGAAGPAQCDAAGRRRPMTDRPQTGLWARIRSARLVEVLGVYAGISFGALQAVDVFIDRLALPDWVFTGALLLLLLGLPLIAATALVQAPRAKPTPRPEPADADSASATASPAAAREDAARQAEPDALAANAPARSSPAVPSPGWQGAVGRPPGREGGMEGAPPPPPAVPGARETGWARWLTWRRALAAGVAGFVVLVLAAGGFTAMHRLGIGPIGSLVAKGVLDERDRILIADFDSQTGHDALAAAVTEAFRVDFEQSTVVTPVPPTFVRDALQRMGRADAARLDLPVAREVARREGIKAVVAGEVNGTGGSFVISVRLLAAADGAVLASFR